MPRAPLPKQANLQSTLQQAVAFHRQGRLDDAERLYNGVLAGEPNNFDALHLLGVLMKQRGRSAEALDLIGRALATGAKSADALMNRANVLFAMKRHAEALEGYNGALALRPDDARLLSNRANTLCELGRPADALAEVEADTARLHAIEGEDAVAESPSDPDRGDPGPRTFDPPRRDIADRCPKPAVAESGIELVTEIDIGRFWGDAEHDPQQPSRS